MSDLLADARRIGRWHEVASLDLHPPLLTPAVRLSSTIHQSFLNCDTFHQISETLRDVTVEIAAIAVGRCSATIVCVFADSFVSLSFTSRAI